MSTFTVPVVRINAIEPIEGADAIELAVIGDYRSVIRKGQYQLGDLAVYIPEQAILPDELIKELGLEGKLAGSGHNRVKAVKLRGMLSQGILYPIVYDAPSASHTLKCEDGCYTFVKEGDNVADDLGIVKWDPPIPTHLSGEVYNAGRELTVAYDIENFKKFPATLVEGEDVAMTEKLHGCLTGDSLVMLPNGEEVSIATIVDGESVTHVLSFDVCTQTFITKPITGRMVRPNAEHKRWVKITLDNGRTLTLTEDHPVYSRDRQSYVPAGELVENEDIESILY